MSKTGFTIAGMHKLTTLDFPGLVSAIVFTQGCNFHCPYCHNAHLIPTDIAGSRMDEERVLLFLRKRAGLLDGVVISGGEPCLQPGLPDFCREVKSLGYAVKLDTNGSSPDVLAGLLENKLVDYVAMDCKTMPEAYHSALCADENITEKILRSARLLKQSGVAHEFRTTCFAPYITENTIQELAETFIGSSTWFLQKGILDDSSMRADSLRACSTADIAALVELATQKGCMVQSR